ncbi:glutathione S-transferase [Xylariaceae sp. FL0255]|nr:glutathione S-transferase [Xylariaceae sp. FL0255]
MASIDGKPTLLHLNDSQSQTILWLLEELEIPYDIKYFERETSGKNKARAPASLKETHMLGKSPQLITASGRVVIERSAISKYLIDTYDAAGKFKISSADGERNDALHEEELLGFAQSSWYVTVMVAVILHYTKTYSPFIVRPLIGAVSAMLRYGFIDKELDAQLKYLNSQLEGQNFFLSNENPTRVDVVLFFMVQMPHTAKVIDIKTYPNVKAWYERCLSRPAWRRGIEKGNGYVMGG